MWVFFYFFMGKSGFFPCRKLLVCRQTLWHFWEHFSGKKWKTNMFRGESKVMPCVTSEKDRACSSRQKIFLRCPALLGNALFPGKRKEEEKEISPQSSFEKKVEEKGSAGLNAKRRKITPSTVRKNYVRIFVEDFSHCFQMYSSFF